ncbi:hypothetical protein ABZ826_01690 [Streptomyces sp. NPDC047515]|uniref:hypothetical protein n=1 Tax=Streptomyces sp. NPDC047515 TaxID=3155380 RepID=UPI00340AD1BD
MRALDEEVRALVGAGVSAQVEQLSPDWADGWTDQVAAWRPTVVLATAYGVPGALTGPLAGLARDAGAAFLAARGLGRIVVKGPLAGPGGGSACWDCLRLQFAANAPDELAARILRDESPTGVHHRLFATPASPAGNSALTAIVDSATGSELATELIKFLSGALDSDLVGAVVVQDAENLETWCELIPLRADCPSCGPKEYEESVGLKAFHNGDADLDESAEERTARYSAVLAPTTGLLRTFDDDDLPQALLRAARLLTSASAATDVYGFSVGTSLDARADAVERALRHAAAHAPSPVPVSRTTAALLRSEGAVVAQAQPPGRSDDAALVTAANDDPPRPWTPALRLRDDATVWVPLDRPVADGPTALAGFGAGATAREVIGAALTSVLLAERLDDWLDGAAPAVPVDAARDIDALHAPLALALRRTGVLRVQALTDPEGDDGDVADVVVARYEAEGRGLQVAAAGPTRRASVGAALLELAGRAEQSDPYAHPDGPGTVLCPAHWPAVDRVPLGAPAQPADRPDAEPYGAAPDRVGRVSTPRRRAPDSNAGTCAPVRSPPCGRASTRTSRPATAATCWSTTARTCSSVPPAPTGRTGPSTCPGSVPPWTRRPSGLRPSPRTSG